MPTQNLSEQKQARKVLKKTPVFWYNYYAVILNFYQQINFIKQT